MLRRTDMDPANREIGGTIEPSTGAERAANPIGTHAAGTDGAAPGKDRHRPHGEAERDGSGGTAPSAGSVADGAVDQGAVERVKMGQQLGNLGEEGIGQNGRDLLFAKGALVADQM